MIGKYCINYIDKIIKTKYSVFMERIFKAIFINSYISINTELIDYTVSSSAFSPMIINGVLIDTDGFEDLTIENIEQYNNEQLKQFDYNVIYPYKDKNKKLLVLKNYILKAFIPINIINKINGIRTLSELILEMNDKEGKINYTILLENEKINDIDIENIFYKFKEQLSEKYIIEICGTCKYNSENPYGGVFLFNQLCFRKYGQKYFKMGIMDKDKFASLMDDKKWETVYLTDSCNEYTN
jgi:hypothetical protein